LINCLGTGPIDPILEKEEAEEAIKRERTESIV
jgi:hypothetical protein